MAKPAKILAYAAALLALSVVALAALLIASPRAQTPARVPAAPATENADEMAPEAPEAPAEPAAPDPMTDEMVKTRTELKAAYAERREDIPEDLAKPIDDDIGMIEGAVADLLAAMVREPDNEDLKRMLVATYRNEFRLLKKALHLSGSEQPEDPEEALEETPEAASTQ